MINIEAAIALVNEEVDLQTDKQLNDLQRAVLVGALQGKTYSDIAEEYNCTEGHAKDTGAWLWKLLSDAWCYKVTKSNLKSSLELELDYLEAKRKQAASLGEPDDKFFGREKEIVEIKGLFEEDIVNIVLQGEGGVGKTTLGKKFTQKKFFDVVLNLFVAKEIENVVSAATVVEEWLERDFRQVSGKDFGVNLDRLRRCLEYDSVGILIDNLETVLDKDGKFLPEHRDYLELLRVITTSSFSTVVMITSRDRLCEPDLHLTHYRLSGLSLEIWENYFTDKKIKLENNNTLAKIHKIYGGNPKAMGIICGVIREDYRGNIEEYWRENNNDPLTETDLKNLVVSQFDRLEKLDIQAYYLLCRLSCYRYQDLATVTFKGVSCLLWDLPENKRRKTIRSLRNRSLVEYDSSEYWLHPIIKAEAQLRLHKFPKQRENSHREIAEFLTNSVTKINKIQVALTAFEAYYHYVEIKDYQRAAKVILYSRENQWKQYLTLGTNLYRLGIIQPLVKAIDSIINKIVIDRDRSELNNILGDLYWTTGKVRKAIVCQEKTIATSQKCLANIPQTPDKKYDLYYWKMLEVDSLLSMGLYHIDLWELDSAATLFQQAIDLAHNTKHHSWSEKAALGMALIKSYLDPTQSPDNIVTRLYRLIVELEDRAYNTGRFAYFMQILGQIFFNLQLIEPASIIWQRAIAFAEESNYTQIEGKCLIGVAKIQCYLENWDIANYYHQQATKLLEDIGAKCDLAESYYQWGLTLQAYGTQESQDYFNKAIELFEQMEAPKQIDKVTSKLA